MKTLLPLIVLAGFVGCEAAANFKLPPFKLLDKDNDGSFTEAEAGKLMVDTARMLTHAAGKKLYQGPSINDVRTKGGIRELHELSDEQYW